MSYFLGVIGSILVILLCVSVHEFGHMIVARLFHVGIVEYSIGMGPSIFSKRKGETVYSIRAFPFGGYCAMHGEESAEASAKGTADLERNKNNHMRFVKPAEYKTDWTEDRKLSSKSAWQKLLIYIAGPACNVLLGAVACMIMIVGFTHLNVPLIKEITPDSPAAIAQMEVGDRVIAINDREVVVWTDFQEYKASHMKDLTDGYDVTVLRDDKEIVLHVVEDPTERTLGVSIENYELERTFSNVMLFFWDSFRFMFNSVFDTFYMLATGQAHLNDLSGFVGITAMISVSVDEAMSVGVSVIMVLLYMLSLISINLGVANLLPLPALDGGRCIITLYEWICRRKVPAKVEYAINTAGFALLMLLMIYVTGNDIIKVFTGKFTQ